MYAFLDDAISNKMVDLLRGLAKSNPAYRDITSHITTAFPYEEKPQRGIYIDGIDSTHVPLSPNNYVGTKISHVFSALVGPTPVDKENAKERPYPQGQFIEWVREDSDYYNKIVKEDLTSQVGSGANAFQASNGNWISDLDEGRPVTIRDVHLWIDDQLVTPIDIDPISGVVYTSWVSPNSTVKLEYRYRNIPEPSGLHFIRITSENTLSKRLMGVVRKATLVEEYDGETSFQLPHTDILQQSLRIHLPHHYKLTEGSQYSVNYSTGLITILTPALLPSKRALYVSYRYDGGQEDGIAFEPGSSSNKIVPGVVIAFGEKVENGAIGVVGTLPERVDVADIYGGRWDAGVTIAVYARSQDAMEEMADWLAVSIIGILKEQLDSQGLALTSVSNGSRSKASYIEGDQDEYYVKTISISLQTDWEIHKSIPLRIEGFGSTFGESALAAGNHGVSPLVLDAKSYDLAYTALERYK